MPQVRPASASHGLDPDWDEVAEARHDDLWVRGGFPASFLARTEERSLRWRREFVRSFTERDLPQLGVGVAAETMRRFWTMLAHGHGQTLNASAIESHPQSGASWESFAITNVLDRTGASWHQDAYFWATHAGAEIGLLVIRGNRRIGHEIQRTVSPRVTRSMRIALDDLSLERVDVLHAGPDTFLLSERIRAVSVYRIREDIERL